MNSHLDISFIIPAYNEEDFITTCINSIIDEMKRYDVKWEIIVVDNASTDNTHQMASSLLSSRRVDGKILDEPNKGIVRARELGWRQSSGNLVAFIDADNVIPTGWFGRMYALMHSNKIACSGPVIYQEFNQIERWFSTLFYKIAAISHTHFGEMLQGGNFIIKRDILFMMNGFDTSIEFYGEDTAIAKAIAHFGDIAFDTEMWVWSSARRMRGEGLFFTTIKYIANYLSIHILNKPVTAKYKDYR